MGLRQMVLEKYFAIKEDIRFNQERYEAVRNAAANWNNFSVAERLAFAQESFDKLNDHYSKAYGINPKDTKFGFCSGIKAGGVYSSASNSISMPYVNCAYFYPPWAIDKVLRHELRHRDQAISNVGKTDVYYRAANGYKGYEHGASPSENDADKSAYLGMMKTSFIGILKSQDRVQAAKDFFRNSKLFIQDRFAHLRDRIAYETNGHIYFGRHKEGAKEDTPVFGQGTVNQPLYYSLGQLTRLVNSNPAFASKETFYAHDKNGNLLPDSGLAIFRGYREAMMPYHLKSSFFGTFNPKTGERYCGVVNNEGWVINDFNRYDKQGNLIDNGDKNFPFKDYVPQEVAAAMVAQNERIEDEQMIEAITAAFKNALNQAKVAKEEERETQNGEQTGQGKAVQGDESVTAEEQTTAEEVADQTVAGQDTTNQAAKVADVTDQTAEGQDLASQAAEGQGVDPALAEQAAALERMAEQAAMEQAAMEQ